MSEIALPWTMFIWDWMCNSEGCLFDGETGYPLHKRKELAGIV